jgi:hypothetical protein
VLDKIEVILVEEKNYLQIDQIFIYKMIFSCFILYVGGILHQIYFLSIEIIYMLIIAMSPFVVQRVIRLNYDDGKLVEEFGKFYLILTIQ